MHSNILLLGLANLESKKNELMSVSFTCVISVAGKLCTADLTFS